MIVYLLLLFIISYVIKDDLSDFVHEDLFVLGGVELCDICGIYSYEFFYGLLQFRALFWFNLLHFAETLVGCEVLLGLFVL